MSRLSTVIKAAPSAWALKKRWWIVRPAVSSLNIRAGQARALQLTSLFNPPAWELERKCRERTVKSCTLAATSVNYNWCEILWKVATVSWWIQAGPKLINAVKCWNDLGPKSHVWCLNMSAHYTIHFLFNFFQRNISLFSCVKYIKIKDKGSRLIFLWKKLKRKWIV